MQANHPLTYNNPSKPSQSWETCEQTMSHSQLFFLVGVCHLFFKSQVEVTSSEWPNRCGLILVFNKTCMLAKDAVQLLECLPSMFWVQSPASHNPV